MTDLTTTTTSAPVPRNALKHGLYAAPDIAVHDEQPGQWFAFHDEVVRSLAPEGILEEALAQRVAVTLWRLRRVPIAEVHAIEQYAAMAMRRPGPVTVPPPDALLNLTRYEGHLNRQLIKSLHELEALQARRRGDPAPLARLDVDVAREDEN